MVEERFRNAKRRLLAAIIDGLMLTVPSVIILANTSNTVFAVYFFNLYAIVPVLYFVLCNYYSGQTLGKSVLDIKVVDNTTEGNISLKQAFLREAPWAVLSGLSLISFILFYVLGIEAVSGLNDTMEYLNENFGSFWWLIEMITMFTNARRRAVHDLLAGTVVIRLQK